MSKRLLLTTLGSYGDINPFVGLALALRSRGHDVVIATSPVYRDYIECAGIGFRPVRPDVDPGNREVVARIMNARSGTEFLLREIILPALRDSYEDLSAAAEGADLLLTHPITFAGPIVAQERRIPWASAVLAPMSFFSEYDLPVFPPIPWAKHLERVPGGARLLIGLAKAITRPWMEPVHRFRAEHGLPRGGDPLYEGQHSPELVLALFSRLLAEPQPDWPPRVRVTGAVLYNGPRQHELSPEIERFLAAGPPPVVFTLGTSAVSAAGNFYDASVEAARRAGVRAILLAGRHAENRPREPLPDTILVVEQAPHAALFPRAAAVVHQGGAGTLHQALHAGVPMLVVPWAHDQPDLAYRGLRIGVARTLTPSRYTPSRAADALRRLLDDSAYRERAATAAAIVRAENAPQAACDAIEAMLR
ncbi:MAG TPA: glycosyltransferase [Gemmatimonadaceae bacterium]|nr:glycosyltransferase [Gemmatimonadaceae bacterium]